MILTPAPRQKGKNILFYYLVILLVAGSFISGLFAGRYKSSNETSCTNPVAKEKITDKYTNKTNVDFGLFWDVWELIDKKFFERPVDHQKMVYGAIEGALQALGDPYTAFMDPEMTGKVKDELGGSLSGVGAEIGVKNKNLTIVSTLPDSPAQKAGLKTGDIVLKINNEDTSEMTLTEAVYKIRGPAGEEVKINFYRPSKREQKDVTIKREQLTVKSVKWEKLKVNEKDVVLLTISSFGDNTSKEFKEAVTDFLAQGVPQGIILDLRNNGGGYLDSSIEVASEFIEKNKIVAIEESSNGNRKELKAQGGNRLTSIPTVILVDGGTASAAEILSGALRDDNQDILIGEKTYGKGSVQELQNLKDGSSVRISIAKWLIPSGKNINKEGLTPDIEVKSTEEDFSNDRDPQLDKAKEKILQIIK